MLQGSTKISAIKGDIVIIAVVVGVLNGRHDDETTAGRDEVQALKLHLQTPDSRQGIFTAKSNPYLA
jgi:hypothetical protein